MTTVSAAGSAEQCTETWPALGTTVVIRHAGPPSRAVRHAVLEEVAAIDAAASRFRPDSELSRLNAAPDGVLAPAGPLLREAVRLAIRAAAVSGGAVDPTLGTSLAAVGYDRDWRELAAIPAGAPLRPADRLVVRTRRSAWDEIEVSDDPPEVRVAPGTSLDLGATAKALAADRAARAAAGVHDGGGLVSLGGDIATWGPAPPGGWAIRVTDDHRDGPSAAGQTVCIRSGGLATSSIAARRWLHEGHPMHHILDPGHGGPVATPWRTVSVAAGSCADANIAATAAIVLGDAAPEWLAAQQLPARLVTLEGHVTVQGGWPE